MLAFVPKFLLIIFLLSGLAKAMSLITNFNLNYITIPLSLIFSLLFVALNRKIKLTPQSIIFLLFFLLSMTAFILNNVAINNGYNVLQITLAITLQYILPIVLICVSGSNGLKGDIFKFPVSIITTLNIMVLFCFILFLLLDHQAVVDFYVELANNGLIINPIQTSEEGTALRFSGVFSSGYLLATYCCLGIIYYYFDSSTDARKFILIYLIFFVMVILTYNRNGILAYIVSTLFIFIHFYFKRYYNTLICMYYIMLIGLIFITPGFLIYFSDAILHISAGSIDHSALTKVSTLFSRINAWLLIVNVSDFGDFLTGTGLVQGLGDINEDFYVDNGYLYLLYQSGILLLIFYILCWSFMFATLSRGIKHCIVYNRMLSNDISMCLLLIIVSFTLAFLNNLFFEPVFLTLVFMKCIVTNNRLKSSYEKNK
jgi:hypothetical protein